VVASEAHERFTEGEAMTQEATQRVMDAYIEALRGGGDFARFYAPDVVWTFTEDGEQVQGRDAVRDVVVGLHTQAFTAHPELRGLLVGDGTAMLEAVFVGKHTGEFADVPATGLEVRQPYCVAYDVAEDAITALRAYFPTAALRATVAAAAQAAATPAHV
jgi:ketosteroid isomerase-like protein